MHIVSSLQNRFNLGNTRIEINNSINSQNIFYGSPATAICKKMKKRTKVLQKSPKQIAKNKKIYIGVKNKSENICSLK